jgi:hypothetical protein
VLILKRIAGLASLTAFALLLHGYHPYAEDAEIYFPGVLKILNPTLFPSNAEFFSQHAGNTLYPNLIAASVKLSHLSLPWVAFLWQIASIFLLLVATWRLAAVLFEEEGARWAAAALMATLLTLPVAGTALYIFDQYLNPRNLAAFAALFAVEGALRHKYGALALCLLFAAAVHPLMASFAIAFCIWLMVLDRYRLPFLGFAAVLPFGLTLDRPPPAYHEVALRQSYFYLLRWEWYEWIGLIAPIVLFWLAAQWARRREMRNLELVSRAMVPFILLAAVSALLLSIPARFEALARLEPLRCLALAYMLLIVIGAGLLNRLLRNRLRLSLVLLVPLGIGMYFEQRALFRASAHIEWPWAQPRNPWAQAFEWIRANTPVDALFALNPDHMNLPGEDENGFRARAERSMLADMVKDKGAASMFPPLATQWWEQVQDAKNFQDLQKADFDRLRQKYGVSWVVVQQPGPAGIDCPYENSAVRVCRID